MCILSGCDYLASIRNIGLRRSFAAVKQNIDITTTMEYFKSNRQLDIPPEYEQNVRKSLECFKSQIVIDSFLLREVSLYESCSQREVIFDKLTGISAIHFMHGNIHPHTGQLKLLFDITKPCIDCYSILHFKLRAMQRRQLMFQLPNRLTRLLHMLTMKILMITFFHYHLWSWEVHIILKCKLT